MTRHEIEQIAQAFGDDRYSLWIECGQHDWPALPLTTDTGEHYCLLCGAFFSVDGALLNQPRAVRELVSERSHQGGIVARVHRGREARTDFFTYEFAGRGANVGPFVALRSGTKEQAQARADERLLGEGHQCAVVQCGEWT